MKIIKRSGEEVRFSAAKIVKAIQQANTSVSPDEALPKEEAKAIADDIQRELSTSSTPHTVEDIQDRVVVSIMKAGKFQLANNYIVYRYQHEQLRKANSTDSKIMSIVNGTNAQAKVENSNKNPDIISVQRDYIAGETSRDITERLLLDPDIVDAHRKGIIHFHDSDYFIQRSHNCDLVNLDDMLQNGTVISGTLIEKPHRFSTACNIATQIIAQVASCQYGGQSISLTHLAKFVDVSRKAIQKDVLEENEEAGVEMTDSQVKQVVEHRLRREVKAGIQTIQYQVLTLMTTNGQAPFITLFMYLDEAGDDQRLKDDLAMCIEEVLKQRMEGVKNEAGAWISPSFPKLIYTLDENNVRPGSKYYYLTELAARCTAKRLVPDYISAKQMRRLKVDENGVGQVYPCMGCRSFLTTYVDPETKQPKYYGRLIIVIGASLNLVNA